MTNVRLPRSTETEIWVPPARGADDCEDLGYALDLDDQPIVLNGVTAGEEPDAEAVYAKMREAWQETAQLALRRLDQRIIVPHGPFCLAAVADLHLGSGGVDYDRVYGEAQIIADMPNTGLALVGDPLDNYILPKLVHCRFDSQVSIPGEWSLVRRYLDIVAHKIAVSVSGNHDNWNVFLTGVNYFRDVLARVSPNVLYDMDDCRFVLQVGPGQIPIRVRHKWRGVSKYNATHGVESTFKEDGDFLIGIGAHTHVSGLVREFNASGRLGLAAVCGSYKAVDTFARGKGFPRPNGNTAVAIIFFENGAMFGTSRLDVAADLMRRLSGPNR